MKVDGGDIVLSDPESIWSNVYTLALFVIVGSVNFCFWMKLHSQRLGKHAAAKKWENSPIWIALAVMVAVFLFW